VLDLREAILAAIEAGEIEELRHAYDMGEPKPDLGAPPKTDPIAHWKSISADGQGRDVLAALSLILEAGYVTIPRGADIENNQLYVSPRSRSASSRRGRRWSCCGWCPPAPRAT
jgi:hypothetical protein